MEDRDKRPSRPPARKPSGPNSQRRREDLPARGGSTSRAGAPRQTRDGSDPRGARPAPTDRDQSRLRPRIFEPDIPEDVTGEELEKSVQEYSRMSVVCCLESEFSPNDQGSD